MIVDVAGRWGIYRQDLGNMWVFIEWSAMQSRPKKYVFDLLSCVISEVHKTAD